MKNYSVFFFILFTVLADCRPKSNKISSSETGEEMQLHSIQNNPKQIFRYRRQTSQTTSTPTPTRIPPANPEITTVYKVSCPCPFTPQYSPVCGSDGQNYGNQHILNCARFCGVNVTTVYPYACGSNRG